MNFEAAGALSRMAKSNPASSKRPPWKKSNPLKRSGAASKKLSSSQKTSAKARAKRAGRPYPNLVDNMRAANGGKKGMKRKARKRK